MSTPRDFLGQELTAGDLIVYPATSGHSTQMVVAMLENVECVDDLEELAERAKWADWMAEPKNQAWFDRHSFDERQEWVERNLDNQGRRAGTPTKAKVRPLNVSSRWRQHELERTNLVTLTRGARSMLKLVSPPPDLLAAIPTEQR